MTIEKLKQSEPIFGSWYVESKIAEGRSSKVFKVSRMENFETEYMCLKVIKFPRSNTEISNAIASEKYQTVDEYMDALQREVSLNMEKMLELQGNENIVHFADFGIIKENSCFYVVMLMELLTPLSDYLKADSIKPKEVIKIGWDLCNALEGFRQAGIMHHNIKPDNIYVDEKGNYKLGDFGISEIGETKLEPGGYSAPELFSSASVDSASDIYSLGVVLYKLLNNNRGPFLPAFPAPISLQDREQANIKRLRGDLFPTPTGADYNLAKIIFKATSYNPLDRYDAPFMMRRDLEMYLKALAAAPVQAPQNSMAVKAHHVVAETHRISRTDGAESVTAEDKNDFALAFTDDESDEDTKPEKKWYYIIMALVIILALVIGLVVKGASDRKKEFGTTEETTTAVMATETTAAVTTTQETTTEVTTTEETTAEETTTEETTTEVTTTEESTTEETTTKETTTEETTTEETTTEETTEQVDDEPTVPMLVGTDKEAGTTDKAGKVYTNVSNYEVLKDLSDTDGKEIIIEISDDLGSEAEINEDVYLYMMINDVTVQRTTPTASIEEDEDGTYICTIEIHDEDFYYEPEQYQYYLCFDEGSIESESMVILPVQITI